MQLTTDGTMRTELSADQIVMLCEEIQADKRRRRQSTASPTFVMAGNIRDLNRQVEALTVVVKDLIDALNQERASRPS